MSQTINKKDANMDLCNMKSSSFEFKRSPELVNLFKTFQSIKQKTKREEQSGRQSKEKTVAMEKRPLDLAERNPTIQDTTEFLPGGDSLGMSLQEKNQQLSQEYQKLKAHHVETEAAFQNLLVIHESTLKRLNKTSEGNVQLYDITQQTVQQYNELKKVTEDECSKLNEANDRINLLEKEIFEGRKRINKLKSELKFMKQPFIDHTPCEKLLEIEQNDKEKVLKQMEEFSDKLDEVTKENELTKEDNRILKQKMSEVVKTENEISIQNQVYVTQLNCLRDILADKDRQIEALNVPKNPFNDFSVKQKIEAINLAHEKEKETMQNNENNLRKEIECLRAGKIELQKSVDQRQNELEALNKRHQLLKQNYDVQEENSKKNINTKEKQIIVLVEAAKTIKRELAELRNKNENLEKEMTVLRENNRVKDIEISVLGDAKELFEEQIKKYLFERDSVFNIAKQFEQQIEAARDRLKELESCKCDLLELLKQTQCKLKTERENFRVQEKILEDNRDTVTMLKCKLRECNHKLYKLEREKEMMKRERKY